MKIVRRLIARLARYEVVVIGTGGYHLYALQETKRAATEEIEDNFIVSLGSINTRGRNLID